MAPKKNKKQIVTVIKLQIKAGKATPAPPLGPALGQHVNGLAIKEFCTAYNEQTRDKSGSVVPAIITIYKDKTLSFELGTPPVSELLKKAVGIQKGSAKPNTALVGKLSLEDAKRIAAAKMKDLNATTEEQIQEL